MALAEYAGTFDEFRKQAEPAVAAAKRGEFDPEVRKRNDYFCASCVPWFSFQSLSQAALTTDQSIVILAWGRLTEEKKLPVAVQANHSLVDGIHFGHFTRLSGTFSKRPKACSPDSGNADQRVASRSASCSSFTRPASSADMAPPDAASDTICFNSKLIFPSGRSASFRRQKSISL